jgi:hypothetical protein
MRTPSHRRAIRGVTVLALGLLLGTGSRADEKVRPGGPVVVQNFYYALPGKADEVYRWRLHASEVRARLGLAVGRVLRRSATPGEEADGELPDVVWECEYADAKARAADVARLEASHAFDAVEDHMQTLIRGFRRAVYTVPTLR